MNKKTIGLLILAIMLVIGGGLYFSLAFGRDNELRIISGECLSFEFSKDIFGNNCTVVVINDGQKTIRFSFEGHMTVRPTYTVEMRYWLRPWHLQAELKYLKQVPPVS